MRKPRRVLRSGLAGIGTVVGVAGGVSLWICGTRSGGRVHCDDLPVVVVDQVLHPSPSILFYLNLTLSDKQWIHLNHQKNGCRCTRCSSYCWGRGT